LRFDLGLPPARLQDLLPIFLQEVLGHEGDDFLLGGLALGG